MRRSAARPRRAPPAEHQPPSFLASPLWRGGGLAGSGSLSGPFCRTPPPRREGNHVCDDRRAYHPRHMNESDSTAVDAVLARVESSVEAHDGLDVDLEMVSTATCPDDTRDRQPADAQPRNPPRRSEGLLQRAARARHAVRKLGLRLARPDNRAAGGGRDPMELTSRAQKRPEAAQIALGSRGCGADTINRWRKSLTFS